jgi:hypothetical protein
MPVVPKDYSRQFAGILWVFPVRQKFDSVGDYTGKSVNWGVVAGGHFT